MRTPLRTLLLVATLASCSESESRPHLFLITADTLRAGHLSVFGYARETSPNLDDFAAASTHFTDAVTPIPKTGPAFATLFTGLHPEEHGVRVNHSKIPEDCPVLAQALAEAGYRTVAFVSNPVLRESAGFGRGFEDYYLFSDLLATQTVEREFLLWADRYDWSRPTFVWLHFLEPHGPYTPPDEDVADFLEDGLFPDERRIPRQPLDSEEPDGKLLGAIPRYHQLDDEDRVSVFVARYDAEIRQVDRAIGRVLQRLRQKDLFDPSWVVFTSDHGESLGEHDYFFEHGWFAYEPTLRVPLMLKVPEQKKGAQVGGQVSLLDLHATLLAGLGVETGAGSGLVPGRDLFAQETLSETSLLIENSDGYPGKYFGLRTSDWKYIIRSPEGSEELYDLRADPTEEANVAQREGEHLARMRAEFQALIQRIEESPRVHAPQAAEDSAATLKKLGDLGY